MTEQQSILQSLNQAQREAVSAERGHILVLAGAGSGKTKVLTCRFAYLVEHYGIAPYSIMALTFTRRAAHEMRERIESLLNRPLGGLWIGTFHGLALRLLRRHHEEAGLPSTFEVLNKGDQLRIVKTAIRELNLDEKRFSPNSAAAFIDSSKEAQQRPKDLIGKTLLEEKHIAIYTAYEDACRQSGLVDFGEILLRTYELLRDHQVLLSRYRVQFQDLLIDEFQDTNDLQYKLIRLLAGGQGKVMAVGDDDQSIYSWRGARVENLQSFQQDFAPAYLVKLEQNYRSTGAILEAANAVINHNHQRIGKHLWTDKGQGAEVSFYEAASELEEADFVLDRIQDWQDGRGPLSEVAILYRSHVQSRVFEEYCMARQVPYIVYGGMPFYERAEIRHALAYMRLLTDPDANDAFARVVNFPPRGIGDKTLNLIRSHARLNNLSLWQSCRQQDAIGQLNSRAKNAVLSFCDQLSSWQREAAGLELSRVADLAITQSGLKQYYQNETHQLAEARVENLAELISACQNYETADVFLDEEAAALDNTARLRMFLDHIMLDSNADNEKNQEALRLMTLHSAKGLEFPLVFLVGMEDNLFPHYKSLEDPVRYEEERRLCYVGITRAMDELYLTCARRRMIYNSMQYNMPSSFLDEIFRPTSGDVETDECSEDNPEEEEWEDEQFVPDDRIAPGVEVLHQLFGPGVVVSVSGSGEHTKARVNFERAGLKDLVLKYAQLSVL